MTEQVKGEDMGTYYSVEGVADVLGYNDQHVRKLIRDGTIRAFKVGKSWLVDPSEVDRLKSLLDDEGRLPRAKIIHEVARQTVSLKDEHWWHGVFWTQLEKLQVDGNWYEAEVNSVDLLEEAESAVAVFVQENDWPHNFLVAYDLSGRRGPFLFIQAVPHGFEPGAEDDSDDN